MLQVKDMLYTVHFTETNIAAKLSNAHMVNALLPKGLVGDVFLLIQAKENQMKNELRDDHPKGVDSPASGAG